MGTLVIDFHNNVADRVEAGLAPPVRFRSRTGKAQSLPDLRDTLNLCKLPLQKLTS